MNYTELKKKIVKAIAPSKKAAITKEEFDLLQKHNREVKAYNKFMAKQIKKPRNRYVKQIQKAA